MILLANGSTEAFEWWKVIGPIAGASVSAIAAIVIAYFNRGRPTRIASRDIGIVSLVRVASGVRPRIKVTFDNIPIAKLSQRDIVIWNKGSTSVEDITLRITFPEDTCVLECELSQLESATREIVSPHVLVLRIPYLNAYCHHKESLLAKIVCDGNASSGEVSGRGNGWSSVTTTYKAQLRTSVRLIYVMIALAFMMLVLSVLFSRSLDIAYLRPYASYFNVANALSSVVFACSMFYLLYRAKKHLDNIIPR